MRVHVCPLHSPQEQVEKERVEMAKVQKQRVEEVRSVALALNSIVLFYTSLM